MVAAEQVQCFFSCGEKSRISFQLDCAAVQAGANLEDGRDGELPHRSSRPGFAEVRCLATCERNTQHFAWYVAQMLMVSYLGHVRKAATKSGTRPFVNGFTNCRSQFHDRRVGALMPRCHHDRDQHHEWRECCCCCQSAPASRGSVIIVTSCFATLGALDERRHRSRRRMTRAILHVVFARGPGLAVPWVGGNNH